MMEFDYNEDLDTSQSHNKTQSEYDNENDDTDSFYNSIMDYYNEVDQILDTNDCLPLKGSSTNRDLTTPQFSANNTPGGGGKKKSFRFD